MTKKHKIEIIKVRNRILRYRKNRIMEELRSRLNHEIEINNFNLNAPSVLKLSMELDRYVMEFSRDYISLPIAQ
jgi:hypothetical protein